MGKILHLSMTTTDPFATQHDSDRLQHRAEFWEPSSLEYRFTAESKRLLVLDDFPCTLPTVQALLVLGIRDSRNSLDKVGWSCVVRAAAMSKDMGLMDAFEESPETDLYKAKLLTAWSVFTWTRLVQ